MPAKVDDHYLLGRISGYTYTSLTLGPLAIFAGLTAIVAECFKVSRQRRFRERLSFHAVAVSEVVAGFMQLLFGVFYHNMFSFEAQSLEILSELANAIYMVAIIFCTSTILQISFRRWVDINSLRVAGIRPLSLVHWITIGTFTFVSCVVLFLNKFVYIRLTKNKESHNLQTAHTITIMAILVIWLFIFLALFYYNIRVLRIARSIQRRSMIRSASSSTDSDRQKSSSARKQQHQPQQQSTVNTKWLRLTLVIYNVASVLFVLKILDYIYLTESRKSGLPYPSYLHLLATVNHIVQTIAILTLPVIWLIFCTHFYIDYRQSNQQSPSSTTLPERATFGQNVETSFSSLRGF